MVPFLNLEEDQGTYHISAFTLFCSGFGVLRHGNHNFITPKNYHQTDLIIVEGAFMRLHVTDLDEKIYYIIQKQQVIFLQNVSLSCF